MLLRSLRVENYRAVQSAKITLDPTTILIGENDCGRSSLMEALALVLGWNVHECEFQFEPFHIHRPQSGVDSPPSIAIGLEFSETWSGEWDSREILRTTLPDVCTGDRCLRFTVTHSAEGATSWSFRAGSGLPVMDNRELLQWLRKTMPVFWLSEGITARTVLLSSEHLNEELRPLADQVTEYRRELLEGTASDVFEAIERGSRAAMQLLHARSSVLADAAATGEVLQEISGRHSTRKQNGVTAGFSDFGTAAQKIGLLLLVGALLRSGGSQVEEGTFPLTLIENPEAHLHPMTLASIWSVIERVNGQKIIATHSETVLSAARLCSVRRLTRRSGAVHEWRVPEGALTPDELRRYAYHLRSRRAAASFGRCWLLVEGETEFWLMSELARVCGYDLASEGIVCVEFAQCGLAALVKVAQFLGIEWHLLADGDDAGNTYARSARAYVRDSLENRITLLREPDVEHCFWRHGYADVFRASAYPKVQPNELASMRGRASAVIHRAVERQSKPGMAILILNAVCERGPEGVPAPLRNAIETCVRLARAS